MASMHDAIDLVEEFGIGDFGPVLLDDRQLLDAFVELMKLCPDAGTFARSLVEAPPALFGMRDLMAACLDLRGCAAQLLAYDICAGEQLFEMQYAEDLAPILAAVPAAEKSVYLFLTLVDRTDLNFPSGAFRQFRDDFHVMVGAMSICPAAIGIASDRLRDDLDFMFQACRQDPAALEFASERLRMELA